MGLNPGYVPYKIFSTLLTSNFRTDFTYLGPGMRYNAWQSHTLNATKLNLELQIIIMINSKYALKHYFWVHIIKFVWNSDKLLKNYEFQCSQSNFEVNWHLTNEILANLFIQNDFSFMSIVGKVYLF